MTVRKLLFAGDSTTLGNTGGAFSWYDLVTERLGNIAGIGPLLTSGIRHTGLGFNAAGWAREWSLPSALTSVLSTDAFDKFPYTAGRRVNGASKIWTWTKPTWMRPVVGFTLYFVDLGGNWQYRVDGGTWFNHNQASHTNQIVAFYVNTPITSTLEIRSSSDATTGVDTFPVGIECYYYPPSTTQGLITHNIAVNGSKLNELVAVTSGDRMAFIDSVVAGTGSPILPTPNAGSFVMHANDVLLNNATTWGNDLTTFRNRCAPLGPVGFINIYEASTPAYQGTRMEAYRDKTKAIAAALSPVVPVLDLYDWFASLGYGPADANSQGGAVAVASDGVDLATLTGAGVVHTGDASAFPATPSFIELPASENMVRYLAKSGSDLTNCKFFSGPGGVMSAGEQLVVTQNALIKLGGPFPYLIDRTHLDANGHVTVAVPIYWFVRDRFLAVGDVPTQHSISAKRADAAYAGSRAAVAYAAGMVIR